MFSYFNEGIKDTFPSKFIGLPELVQLIRFNPEKDKIEIIRSLRRDNDVSYKKLKDELPNITPVCMVKRRNLSTQFDDNFIQFSQYLYFDFDVPNAQEFKKYFITKYDKYVSIVCVSSSGGGISVLVKVKNTITRENFPEIWQKVKDTFFKDEKVDANCRNIGRAMFISYDPEVYFNYENEIEVPYTSVGNKTIKRENQCIILEKFNNTLEFPEKLMHVDDILKTLSTKTRVPVSNPVLDYKPVEIVKFFIPRVIFDGEKHNTYRRMIHTLIYLNPMAHRNVIFSYIWYINNRFAKPKMARREFVRFFNLTYIQARESGILCITKKTVWIHFNPNCGLTKNEKRRISSIINGVKIKNESIRKIIDAKIKLSQEGQLINQPKIQDITGLCTKTIRKYYNSDIEDLEGLVQALNDTYSIAA